MKSLLIEGIRKYSEETNAKGYIIGISGGKDSTVVASLLCEAVGNHNVLGVMMPNGIQSDIEDSKRVCEMLKIESMTVPVGPAFDSMLNSIEWAYKLGPDHIEESNLGSYKTPRNTSKGRSFTISDKAKTNIPPRLRMTILYALGQTLGLRVAGTGNRSERYIRWFTKGGDGQFDYNPISPLCCTQVVKLGDELGLDYDLVHKTPADGLTGRSDEDNLGFTYQQLDDYLLIGTSGDNDIDKKIEQLHLAGNHKLGGGYTSATQILHEGERRYGLSFVAEDTYSKIKDLMIIETVFVKDLID